MLPSLGYFRGINCPGIREHGKCKRPYCHFHHSNATAEIVTSANCDSTELDEINRAINQLRSEINDVQSTTDDIPSDFLPDEEYKVQPSYSYSTNESESESYVPYKPYQAAAELYKPFSSSDSTIQKTIDHSKLYHQTKRKSVLHGAKGATAKHRKTQQKPIKYTLSTTRKPVNDLEYDPMCNYDMKTKSSGRAASSEEEPSDVKPSVAVEDELLPTDLVIDDDSFEPPEQNPDSESGDISMKDQQKDAEYVVEDMATAVTYVPARSSVAHAQNSNDEPIVISDSDSDCCDASNVENAAVKAAKSPGSNSLSKKETPRKYDNATTLASKLKQKIVATIELFGTDSESESTNLTGESSHNHKTKQTKTALKEKLHKKVSPQSKEYFPSKSKDKITLKTTHKFPSKKVKSTKIKPNCVNVSKVVDKNIKATKRKGDEKYLIQQKKIKSEEEVFSKMADISKYVDKDEIESLYKDPDGIGKYEECYRIYQESCIDENKKTTAKKENVVDEKKISEDEMEEKKQGEELEYSQLTPQQSRRVAHATASSSATSLNRTPKQARRILTPAQAMMSRMETIQYEQEERILSAALHGFSPTPSSKNSSRVAHGPSTILTKSSLSVSRRHLHASKSFYSIKSSLLTKKQPFQDLKRPTSSASTTKGTVTKGCGRIAHAQNKLSDSSKPDKPRILPDRFSKVPTNVRQRYLTVFIDECLRICENDHSKAYKMATVEESQCSSRSKSKTIYLSLAASTVKKLRAMKPATTKLPSAQVKKSPKKLKPEVNSANNSSLTKVAFKTNTNRISHGMTDSEKMTLKEKNTKLTQKNNSVSHKSLLDRSTRTCKGGYSFTEKQNKKSLSGEELYEQMCHYIMTEKQLNENGFPRPGDLPGMCKFLNEQPKMGKDKTKKICARCGKIFVLYKGGHFALSDDECIHHWGRAYSTKVGSNWEKRYSCCQTPVGSEGCTVGETHVHRDNQVDCTGYVKTLWKVTETGDPGIYALDCEMAYTVAGLELIRVSVVDFECKLVYDSLVQPSGRILDYNTRWSGLAEDDLKDVKTTLRDVQTVLLSKFSSDTIFMGHSLESDLKALRIIHNSVIDTSVVFPHRLGPPYKRALRNLMSEHLGIVIQNAGDEGHDSLEDATACVKLMKWRLGEDMKVSR